MGALSMLYMCMLIPNVEEILYEKGCKNQENAASGEI